MCAAFQDQTAAGEFFIENGASLALKEYKVRQCSVPIAMLPQPHIPHSCPLSLLFLLSSLRVLQHGWTVLHGATRYGRMELVELLLEAGCDANVTDNVRNGWLSWSGLRDPHCGAPVSCLPPLETLDTANLRRGAGTHRGRAEPAEPRGGRQRPVQRESLFC